MAKRPLLTAALRSALPALYSTEGLAPGDKVAVVKFFLSGRGTWYATEFDGKDTFFGYIVSPLGDDCDEWGYFSLSEFEGLREYRHTSNGNGSSTITGGMERDLHFKPRPMRDVLPAVFGPDADPKK